MLANRKRPEPYFALEPRALFQEDAAKRVRVEQDRSSLHVGLGDTPHSDA